MADGFRTRFNPSTADQPLFLDDNQNTQSAHIRGPNAVLGNGSQASQNGGVSIGRDATSSGASTVVIGDTIAGGTGAENVYIGNGHTITAATIDNVVIGADCTNGNSGCVILGHNCNNSNTDSVVIGSDSFNNGLNSVAIGHDARVGLSSASSVAIGDDAEVSDTFARGVAIGVDSIVAGNDGIAIGNSAQANLGGAVALGPLVQEASANTVAIGSNSITPFVRISALGTGVEAANAVTINAWSGKVTLAAALAAGAGFSFTLTNSFITANSVVLSNVEGVTATADATRDALTSDLESVGAGSCVMHVYNGDAAITSAAPIVHFLVIGR